MNIIFGCHAMIQQWAGWQTTEMLEVYAHATGAEECELAEGIWEQ